MAIFRTPPNVTRVNFVGNSRYNISWILRNLHVSDGSSRGDVQQTILSVFGMVMTSVLSALTGLAYYFKSHCMVYGSSITHFKVCFNLRVGPQSLNHGKLVWTRKAWSDHGFVERAHECWKYRGNLLAAASLNIGGAGERRQRLELGYGIFHARDHDVHCGYSVRPFLEGTSS